MTVVYFMDDQKIRQKMQHDVSGWDCPQCPIGFAADGKVVDNETTEVAVLLIDDYANPSGKFVVNLKLTEPITALLHRADVSWQGDWLVRVGAKRSLEFSNQVGNEAYDLTIKLLSAPTDKERAAICQQIAQVSDTRTFLRDLEELAAWVALPERTDGDNEIAKRIYDALVKNLPRAAADELWGDTGFKELAVLTAEDLENVAAKLMP